MIKAIKSRLFRKRKRFFIIKTPKYINRHPGKDFLILATGPTIKTHRKQIQDFIDKKNPIVIATNFIDGLYEPEYHMFNSRARFCTYAHTVSPFSILLLVPWLPTRIIKAFIGNRYYEKIMIRSKYPGYMGKLIKIKKGICHFELSSVATVAAGTALVMGAKKIYFAGLDGFSLYRPKEIHFFNEKQNISYGRRLIHEGATYDILNDLSKYAPIEIITPTVYKEYENVYKKD